MTEPRLTIVIPTFNRPHLLPRAIRGCLNQTEPVKLLICDDGKTDDTEAMLRAEFIAEWRERRIEHVHSPAKTAWQNWKFGMEWATTEFVAWHQDDDVVRPTYAKRIIQAFDRFPDANIWMARLSVAADGRLGLWCSGNGPWVPMDLINGDVSSYAEGSILASTAYFTSWSLAPAMAFRRTDQLQRALDAMPDDCDIFVERLIPALACNGGSFIADPIIAGYWIQHDGQLSTAQHHDQPRQTKLFVAALDDLMDTMPASWEESLAAWCQLIPSPTVVQWAQQIDTTVKEGGLSRHARKVQEILIKSLVGRVRFGWSQRWYHKTSRKVRDAATWVKGRLGVAA